MHAFLRYMGEVGQKSRWETVYYYDSKGVWVRKEMGSFTNEKVTGLKPPNGCSILV